MRKKMIWMMPSKNSRKWFKLKTITNNCFHTKIWLLFTNTYNELTPIMTYISINYWMNVGLFYLKLERFVFIESSTLLLYKISIRTKNWRIDCLNSIANNPTKNTIQWQMEWIVLSVHLLVIQNIYPLPPNLSTYLITSSVSHFFFFFTEKSEK